MTKRLRQMLDSAHLHQAKLQLQAQQQDSFAYKLASQSMASHIDDLTQQLTLCDDKPVLEVVEFRLLATRLRDGSVPLRLIAKAAEEIRQMIGYAALRLIHGGRKRKRVPDNLYDDLDLRLAAVLPGSSRLVITTSAQRDLFDDGLSKGVLDRIFAVLESRGKGESFLESVTDLGPASARHLRDLLRLIRASSTQLKLSWRYSGSTVREWDGNDNAMLDVTLALGATEIAAQEDIVLEGIVELLSKRERVHLLTNYGEAVRILFPKRLLQDVSLLHLDQRVTLRCTVTETENPLTGESSTFYELLEVVS